MKKLLFMMMLLLFAVAVQAQPTLLRGKCTLQNSNGQPADGVQISASGASPTTSNTFGFFELAFQDKRPGDLVSLTVLKSGLEVVNRDDLAHVVLRKDPDDLLVIVLCPEGTRDENAARYYNIALQNYNKQINEIKEEIKKLPANSERVRQLEKQLADLQQKWDDSQQLIKELTEKFAAVNLDDTDSLYTAAFEYFQKGNIEAAHQTLNPETLKKNVCDAKQELKRIEQLEQELEQRKRTAQQNVAKTIEAYKLKADLFVAQLQWEDAEYFYEQAVLADTTDFDNVFELAYYLARQNRHKKAIHWYEIALKLTSDEYQYSSVLNNLAVLYRDQHDYPAAQAAYQRALAIRERLAATNPQSYEPYVANTLNNLANLYSDQHDYPAAQAAYQRALAIYERLAATNPQSYEPYVATTLNNLANLYSDQHDYPAAQAAYQRALAIKERLAATNPQSYEPDVAMTLNNLAVLYHAQHDYPAAQAAYQRALAIRERLAATNPQSYEPDVAMTLNNLAFLYKAWLEATADLGYKQKGLDCLLRSEKVLESCPDIPVVQNYRLQVTLLKLYFDVIEPDRLLAEKYRAEADSLVQQQAGTSQILAKLKQSAECYEKLLPNDPELDYAWELSFVYGKIAEWSEPYPEKVNYTQMVVKLRQQVHAEFKNENTALQLANAYGNLSWYLLFEKRFAEAELAARSGLNISDSSKAEGFDEQVEWINTNLATALLYQGKYEEAELIYKKYQDQPYNEGKTWNEVFLDDLSTLEKAGITHPDVQKVKRLLEK